MFVSSLILIENSSDKQRLWSAARMRRLVWAFAVCTYHIVGNLKSRLLYKLGIDARKPVFGVFDQKRIRKSAHLQRIVRILNLWVKLGIILSLERIIISLIRLRKSAGWTEHLLFECDSQIFSRRDPSHFIILYSILHMYSALAELEV